jgi:hypothetical protein
MLRETLTTGAIKTTRSSDAAFKKDKEVFPSCYCTAFATSGLFKNASIFFLNALGAAPLARA